MTSSVFQRMLQDRIVGPTVLLLRVWQAYSKPSPPKSRTGVLSLRPCSLCVCVFPSLPMSHLFIRHAANSTSHHSILASGKTFTPNTILLCSFQCSGLTNHESYRAFDDSVGLPLPLVVSLAQSGFLLDELVQFPLPTPQSLVCCHSGV